MRRRRLALAATLALAAAGATVFGLDRLDRRFPPPLAGLDEAGIEVVDRDGRLLRAFADEDGRWRLSISTAEVDPQFLAMLLAYEDRRFHDHPGIDLLALARATAQFLGSGRIVSGASTLTMQLARLIEPRETRSLAAKLRQMARALQIERRLDKQEILLAYLMRAPYGGNLEGVRAAALAWFGKEPSRLLPAESALLVALPQLPERRRPDRYPEAAREARDRVLARMAAANIIDDGELARALASPVPTSRRALPAFAPHLAELARRRPAESGVHRTTIDRSLQAALETVAKSAGARLGRETSVAILVADALSGEILAEVGSADYFDDSRQGWISMTRQPRSPGSALKPFIYGLAFAEGIAMPETLIADRPANFDGYRPRNFDLSYQGDVTVRAALEHSLNVPALALLESVGPERLAGLFRRAGVEAILPRGEAPGLAIGLGGVGMTLKDLVQLYTVFPGGGTVTLIGNGIEDLPRPGPRLLDPAASWRVADILAGTPRPALVTSVPLIAFKTGTSYGYRDAWSVGFNGRHVIGVWTGTPDNRAHPGMTGITAAAPILFEAFARIRSPDERLPPPPVGARHIAAADLPAGLKRFARARGGLVQVAPGERPPEIVYPPDGARVQLGQASSHRVQPLVMKLQGGRAPFRILANGKPLAATTRRHQASWHPDGRGFSTLTVIDADGRAASVTVYVD